MPAASSSQHPAPAPSSPALIPSSSPPAAALSSSPSSAHGHSHSHNSTTGASTSTSTSTSRSSRLLGLNSYLKKKSLTLTRDHNNHHHSPDHVNPAHTVVVRPRPQNNPAPTTQQTSPHHIHPQSAHPGQPSDATTTTTTAAAHNNNNNNNNSPADASTADAAPIHTIARRPVASLFRTVSSSSPNSRAVTTATPSATSASGSPSIFPASWSRSRSTSPLSSQGPAPASPLSSPDAGIFPHVPSQSAPTLSAQPSAAAAAPPPAHAPTSLESLAVVEPDRGIGAGPMTRTRAATASEASVLAQGGGSGSEAMPSIRFSTFYDPRATRPSLTFSPISRTLPTGTEVIRVGRYSERDAQPNVPVNVPSAAPVGFKSKVVSRRHCEFWHEGGKWYIKDVKSSSGTFLNHIRLSPPGTESKPFPINDGDIVQLGIDFKGGEEMIFRCVKMRLELNRGWQSKLNAFNMNTHKRLRNMTKSGDGGASSQTSQDCSICLNSIAPCQCLFVAPCSHTWHYKCIRSLLASPQYPIFICPNCRAAADLEAEVEDPEEWEQMDSDLDESAIAGPEVNGEGASTAAATNPNATTTASASLPVLASAPVPPAVTVAETEDAGVLPVPPSSTDTTTPSSPQAQPSHATSTPLPIPRMPSSASSRRLAAQGATSGVILDAGASRSGSEERDTRTPSPTPHPPALLNAVEGPITPRNDAGPWVFDGSGVRMRAGPPTTAAASTTVAGAPGRNAPPQLNSLDDIARA